MQTSCLGLVKGVYWPFQVPPEWNIANVLVIMTKEVITIELKAVLSACMVHPAAYLEALQTNAVKC